MGRVNILIHRALLLPASLSLPLESRVALAGASQRCPKPLPLSSLSLSLSLSRFACIGPSLVEVRIAFQA